MDCPIVFLYCNRIYCGSSIEGTQSKTRHVCLHLKTKQRFVWAFASVTIVQCVTIYLESLAINSTTTLKSDKSHNKLNTTRLEQKIEDLIRKKIAQIGLTREKIKDTNSPHILLAFNKIFVPFESLNLIALSDNYVKQSLL